MIAAKFMTEEKSNTVRLEIEEEGMTTTRRPSSLTGMEPLIVRGGLQEKNQAASQFCSALFQRKFAEHMARYPMLCLC